MNTISRVGSRIGIGAVKDLSIVALLLLLRVFLFRTTKAVVTTTYVTTTYTQQPIQPITTSNVTLLQYSINHSTYPVSDRDHLPHYFDDFDHKTATTGVNHNTASLKKPSTFGPGFCYVPSIAIANDQDQDQTASYFAVFGRTASYVPCNVPFAWFASNSSSNGSQSRDPLIASPFQHQTQAPTSAFAQVKASAFAQVKATNAAAKAQALATKEEVADCSVASTEEEEEAFDHSIATAEEAFKAQLCLRKSVHRPITTPSSMSGTTGIFGTPIPPPPSSPPPAPALLLLPLLLLLLLLRCLLIPTWQLSWHKWLQP
jgi:hypothetical protein